MTKTSSKDESEERGNVLGLIQQFKNLEQEWKSLEKSRPIKNPRRYSATTTTGSDNNSCRSIITSFEQLLSNSPREIMSSLQQRDKSPSDVISRVKSCDDAVEEVLGERRAAITSGKIKGRRLIFLAEERRSEEMELNYGGDGGGEICSDCSSNSHGREVVVVDENSSGEIGLGGENSFSDSSCTEEKGVVVEEEKEKAVVEVEEKSGGDRRKKAIAWFALVLILLTLGLISMTSCNGKYVKKNEFTLVPT